MKTSTKILLSAAALAGAAKFLARRRYWPGFRGRVVLITGGSRGLGLALARDFAASGARLAICARDDRELERAKRQLNGAEVFTGVCDIRKPVQAERFVREVEKRFGAIDVVVNNAGTMQVGPYETMTYEDFESAMAVHFRGPLHVTLAALPGMRRRRVGRVVNIASVGGKISVPHMLPYSASKFALVGFSEGLRAELAKDGVLVTTVCPGLMRTGSPPHVLFKGKSRMEYAWFSVSDSLPVISTGVERAARLIVEACRRGDAELILTIPAKAAVAFHGLFPGATTRILGVLDRLLPGSDGSGARARLGRDSESPASRLLVTRLSRRAAAENNELG